MTKPKRKQIGKRKRFEIFKRDKFQCQYCGQVPPVITLHVDHINPVSLGGGNESGNLITACCQCNLGKSNIPLKDLPESLKDHAERIKERESQINGYNKIIRSEKIRIEKQVWEIVEILFPKSKKVRTDWFISIKKFIKIMPFFETEDAAEIAYCQLFDQESSCFLYFCGVCRRKIERSFNGS